MKRNGRISIKRRPIQKFPITPMNHYAGLQKSIALHMTMNRYVFLNVI
jgi:hypothetical protein